MIAKNRARGYNVTVTARRILSVWAKGIDLQKWGEGWRE